MLAMDRQTHMTVVIKRIAVRMKAWLFMLCI